MKRWPGVFRTFRALFSHIQEYSEPCATLAYAETWHIRNPGIFQNPSKIISQHIFKTLSYLRKFTNIQRPYLKPNTYAESSQRFKMEYFAKTYIYFFKALLLRYLTEFWIRNLSINTDQLLEWPCTMYCKIHIQNPV